MEARTNEQSSFLHPEGAVRHKARGLGVPVQAFSIRPSDNDSSIVSRGPEKEFRKIWFCTVDGMTIALGF